MTCCSGRCGSARSCSGLASRGCSSTEHRTGRRHTGPARRPSSRQLGRSQRGSSPRSRLVRAGTPPVGCYDRHSRLKLTVRDPVRDGRQSKPGPRLHAVNSLLGDRNIRLSSARGLYGMITNTPRRRCSVQVAVRRRRRRSARTRWGAVGRGGRRPGLRPSWKSWRSHPRPAMPADPATTGAPRRQYRISYPADLVPALTAKCGLKLIGKQPSGRLEGARIGTARPWRTALARCASPGRAGVSAAGAGVTYRPC